MSTLTRSIFRVRQASFLPAMLFGLFLAGAAPAQDLFLDEPAPIRSAAEVDYPPFSVLEPDGRAGGFSVELLRAALAAEGREVTFRVGTWAEVKGWLERGEVQALPLVGRTPERESFFDFTFPYMSLHGAIVVRAGTDDIHDLHDLRGKQVAVMKADNAEEFLRREDLGVEIHTTATFEQALQELVQGLHDAVVVQRLVALRLLEETGLTNLRVLSRPVQGFRQDFCFAVREGDRNTLALLNEGLALVMADGTYSHLHAKWFAYLERPPHRRILVGGDHNYPPYEYLDEAMRPAGYNVDLTRAIARETGLDIEIRLGPWAEVRQALEEGRIDALQGMFYSPQRGLTLHFTQPHTVSHHVAVVRKGDGRPPATPGQLVGKRIVVQRGDIMHDWAVHNGYEDRLTTVENQEDALRALAEGEHDCALAARMTALYLIRKHGWENLKVGTTSLLSPEYCYAVAPNQRALMAELGEGLKILAETGEYRRIHEEWMGVYEDLPPNPGAVVRRLAMVIVPLVLVLLAVSLWSWSLRRKVGQRTAELARSEAKYRSYIRTAPTGVLIADRAGRYREVNPAACAMTKYSESELLSMHVGDLVPPEVRTPVQEYLSRLARTGLASGGGPFRRKDGTLGWWYVEAVKLDEDRFMGITTDLSEQKRLEREYFFLLKSMSNAFVLFDSVFDEKDHFVSYRFVIINDAYERITGVRNEEVQGKTVHEVWPGTEPEWIRRYGKTAVTGETQVFDLYHEPTKKHYHCCVYRPWDSQERFCVVFEDITERRQAEAERERIQGQLLQAQRLESIGRLAGGVAHDFNNMLGVIMGYADLGMNRVEPGSRVHADLVEIFKAAGRAEVITRQLLAFARRQTIAPVPLELNRTVEGTLNMLRRLIGEDIHLAWRPAPALWPVRMDPSQVDQILVNLAVNARDAIAGVGRITIETDPVTFDEAYCTDHPGFVPGRFVLLSFSDDGCGMDEETQNNMFEPFFTTKDAERGTGLGLATVYGIVKQNNGFINAYSEPGKGTTFRIYLPAHEGSGAEVDADPPAAEAAYGRGETVLLVEDESSLLHLAKTQLERLGYIVLAAESPREAIDLAKKHAGRIDLVITDVIMPEMNGRDLALALKALYPTLAILYMSGYTADLIAHRGVLDEGVHFIQKPFSTKHLAGKVRTALQSPVS